MDKPVISLTYAITVCNELNELIQLVNFLQPKIRDCDNILIQYDSDNTTSEVMDYLKIVNKLHDNIDIISFPLNGDFATFKNNLTKYAKGDYILNIDADEMPHEYLIEYLPRVLETNQVDVVFIPRINTVEGITNEHIFKWGWRVDKRGWINHPDYQLRLYKRTDDIKWMNKVHETLTGYNTISNFPAEEEWSLYHHKDIKRQEKQNEFYNKLA